MFSEEERILLVELLEKRPDITLDEIRMHFGKQCSLNAVHKIVKALGFVFKKLSERKSRIARTSYAHDKDVNYSSKITI